MSTTDGGGSQSAEESVSIAVVDAVAEKVDETPTTLPSLTGTIDPDALDALFRGNSRHGNVEFDYHGYRVRVSSDGDVSVDSNED